MLMLMYVLNINGGVINDGVGFADVFVVFGGDDVIRTFVVNFSAWLLLLHLLLPFSMVRE